jgi:hypothetical protein
MRLTILHLLKQSRNFVTDRLKFSQLRAKTFARRCQENAHFNEGLLIVFRETFVSRIALFGIGLERSDVHLLAVTSGLKYNHGA